MTPDELLHLLRSRRSIREFSPEAVDRPLLERLLEAARTAPSAANRQPWRFFAITAPGVRRAIADTVRRRAEELCALADDPSLGEELRRYTGHFHRPLAAAPAMIVAASRELPDLLGSLVHRAGADPARFSTERAARTEAMSLGAAVMNLCLMAHASGLGTCWMSGPLIAAEEIERAAGVLPPWRAHAVVAVGRPAGAQPEAPPRRPLSDLAFFLEEE